MGRITYIYAMDTLDAANANEMSDDLCQTIDRLRIENRSLKGRLAQLDYLQKRLEKAEEKLTVAKDDSAALKRIEELESEIQTLLKQAKERDANTTKMEEMLKGREKTIEDLLTIANDRELLRDRLREKSSDVHRLQGIVDDDQKHARLTELEAWLRMISGRLGVKAGDTSSLMRSVSDTVRKLVSKR